MKTKTTKRSKKKREKLTTWAKKKIGYPQFYYHYVLASSYIARYMYDGTLYMAHNILSSSSSNNCSGSSGGQLCNGITQTYKHTRVVRERYVRTYKRKTNGQLRISRTKRNITIGRSEIGRREKEPHQYEETMGGGWLRKREQRESGITPLSTLMVTLRY